MIRIEVRRPVLGQRQEDADDRDRHRDGPPAPAGDQRSGGPLTADPPDQGLDHAAAVERQAGQQVEDRQQDVGVEERIAQQADHVVARPSRTAARRRPGPGWRPDRRTETTALGRARLASAANCVWPPHTSATIWVTGMP